MRPTVEREHGETSGTYVDNTPAKHIYSPGDVITLPHYRTAGGPSRKRVWKVIGVHLGATHQEGTYELAPCDLVHGNTPIFVPCLMLETHPLVTRI